MDLVGLKCLSKKVKCIIVVALVLVVLVVLDLVVRGPFGTGKLWPPGTECETCVFRAPGLSLEDRCGLFFDTLPALFLDALGLGPLCVPSLESGPRPMVHSTLETPTYVRVANVVIVV